jgi:hypothetical protein
VARAAAAALGPLAPGHGQVVFASGESRAKRAVTLHLVIKPNARGRQAVARHPGLRVSVAVRYTPKGGTSRVLRFTFRIP